MKAYIYMDNGDKIEITEKDTINGKPTASWYTLKDFVILDLDFNGAVIQIGVKCGSEKLNYLIKTNKISYVEFID